MKERKIERLSAYEMESGTLVRILGETLSSFRVKSHGKAMNLSDPSGHR